jgi:hypothetical protein
MNLLIRSPFDSLVSALLQNTLRMSDEKHPQVSHSRGGGTGNDSQAPSVADSIAASFEASNISKSPRVIEHGQELHANSTTFASSGLEGYYKPSEGWEGLHRYDTEFTWQPEEEKKLVRKVRTI